MKGRTRRWIARAVLLGVLLAGAGFLVAAAGVVPITASSGHWAITRWFLEFSKRRSVATHTLGAPEPDLSADWLVLKGAGHYEGGCSPCHGSPLMRTPRIASAMTPTPPYLPPRVGSWEPEELVYIVEHGIKLTGMPAWPARGRRDEVDAVVAFLLALPDLDAEGYRRLVHGDEPVHPEDMPLRDLPGARGVPRTVLASCARCHGADGNGRGNAAFPRLAGQRVDYMVRALAAYGSGARHSGIMQPIAAALSADDRREASEYYAALPGATGAGEPTAAQDLAEVDRGRQIAEEGIPARGIPSCIDCHGPRPGRRNPAYPDLAGQFADYLVLQLELFAAGRRGGSAFAHLMGKVAPRLRAEERRAVAAYYASLPAGAGGR
jgi:cytochrome c553